MRKYVIALAFFLLLVIPAGIITWANSTPNGPAVEPTANPGEILVSWEIADNAQWVYVGWVDLDEFDAMTGAGRDWRDAIHFVTVPAAYTSHTISGLKPGTEYFVAVGTHAANSRYDAKDLSWSQQWARVTTTSSECIEPSQRSGAPEMIVPDRIESSSTTAGADVTLTLTISDPGPLIAGSSVVLYLEDDFQVSDIDANTVYFVGAGIDQVYVPVVVDVDDDDYFGGGDDWSIQVFVPDMNPCNDTGFDDWSAADARGLQLVLDKAGIKNPTEQGTHSVGYSVLGPDDSVGDPEVKLDDVEGSNAPLATWAKISLSDEDAGRGKDVTVTGTGFNNGTGAEVFVLVSDTKPTCLDVVTMGESLGAATVGSDDRFVVTFTVHQDEFDPGPVNWICAADSEAGNPRFASEVKLFDLEPSLTVSPTSASYGEEITLKPRDFPGSIESIRLGPRHIWTNDGDDSNDDFAVEIDGSDYILSLPGGLDERIQIGVVGTYGVGSRVTKRVYITVYPSTLLLSKYEVIPDESILIIGRGFDETAEIHLFNITLDGEPLDVETSGADACADGYGHCIKVDSNGEFVIEARVWGNGSSNLVLNAGTYTLQVMDSSGFEGAEDITIHPPTISVTPGIAGPGDDIVISGTNWPLSSVHRSHAVTIVVDGQTHSAVTDSTGRFSRGVRLSSDIALGKSHTVTVGYYGQAYYDYIEKETKFVVLRSGASP